MLDEQYDEQKIQSNEAKISSALDKFYDTQWATNLLRTHGIDTTRVSSAKKVGVGVAGVVLSRQVHSTSGEYIVDYFKKFTHTLPGSVKHEFTIPPGIRGEAECVALNMIKNLDIKGLITPEVLFYDPGETVLVTAEVKGINKSKRISPDSDSGGEEDLGRILAEVHKRTFNSDRVFSEKDAVNAFRVWKFRSSAALEQANTDPIFYKQIEGFFKEMDGYQLCRTHNDLTPRNAYKLDSGETAIFDWELSGVGDPAADIGFFLAHYVLESIKNPNDVTSISEKALSFWNSYRNTLAEDSRFSINDIEERALKYLSLGLYYRGWFTTSMPVPTVLQTKVYEKARSVFDMGTMSEVFPLSFE